VVLREEIGVRVKAAEFTRFGPPDVLQFVDVGDFVVIEIPVECTEILLELRDRSDPEMQGADHWARTEPVDRDLAHHDLPLFSHGPNGIDDAPSPLRVAHVVGLKPSRRVIAQT
jgi:hypothetical protein